MSRPAVRLPPCRHYSPSQPPSATVFLVFGWFDSRLERFGFHFVRIEDRFACRDVELPPVPRTANDPSRPDPPVLTGAVRFRGAAEFPLTERCALVWAVVFIA